MSVGREPISRVLKRLEHINQKVHNGAWRQTGPAGQIGWKILGVRVYTRLQFRVWTRFS